MHSSVHRAALRALFMIASAMRTTSGERTVKHTVSCDAGYRVYSVTTNDGHWLDAMTILCTGGGDALQIPDPDSDGGVEGGGPDPVLWANCGNTTGLQAMVFTRPIESFCKGGSEDGPVINLNVTCMNNETYSFANDNPAWDATNVQTPAVNVSCEPDEYVVGISANIRIFNDTDCDGRSHVITSVDFECSGEDLANLCKATDCSGGRPLKSEEDLPDFCAKPLCSEDECCDEIADTCEASHCSDGKELKSKEDLPESCESPSCSEDECCQDISGSTATDIGTDVIGGVVLTGVLAVIGAIAACFRRRIAEFCGYRRTTTASDFAEW